MYIYICIYIHILLSRRTCGPKPKTKQANSAASVGLKPGGVDESEATLTFPQDLDLMPRHLVVCINKRITKIVEGSVLGI